MSIPPSRSATARTWWKSFRLFGHSLGFLSFGVKVAHLIASVVLRRPRWSGAHVLGHCSGFFGAGTGQVCWPGMMHVIRITRHGHT
jgi:hypothetical protein